MLRWGAGNTLDISTRPMNGDPYIDTNGNDVTFAHPSSASFLRKIGAGTLTIPGAHYELGLRVDGGTLAVNGDLSVTNIGFTAEPGSYMVSVTKGALVLQNGTFDVPQMMIGYSEGDNGIATISNAHWRAGDVVVGGYLYSNTNGTLNLTNGSQMEFGNESSFGLLLGLSTGSRGTLNLRGASRLSTSGLGLNLQGYGSGRVSVTEGSIIDAPHSITLGQSGSPLWQLAVDGSGSTVNTTYFTLSGDQTYVDITHGGRLNTTMGVFLPPISNNAPPGARVTISGAGSLWNSAGGDFINHTAIAILDGGKLSVGTGTTYSTSSMQVGGTGSLFEATGSFLLGGSNFVYNGGTIRARTTEGTLLPMAVRSVLTIGSGDGLSAGGTVEAAQIDFGPNVNGIFNGRLSFLQTDTVTFAPSITGFGWISQGGSGSTVLTGASTFAGPTDVAAGTLLINGSISGTNIVHVMASSTLGGTGQINALEIIVTGVNSRLAPGASGFLSGAGPETLGLNKLHLGAGSTLAIDLDSRAPLTSAADLLLVGGPLVIDNAVSLALTDLSSNPVPFALGTRFSIVNYSTWNAGRFTVGTNQKLADGDIFSSGLNYWQIDYDAFNPGLNFATEATGPYQITLTAVIPEPATASIVLTGLGVLLAFPRTRRRKTNRQAHSTSHEVTTNVEGDLL